MDKVPVYILAGGRSSRFGSDKARAMLHGQPLILHVAEALRPLASAITVVAEVAEKYGDLGLRTIADERPGFGPLGGLVTALSDCPHPWLLLTPCDFSGIRPEWIGQLMEGRSRAGDAVAFCRGRWEPLPALYGQAILDRARHGLETSDWSLRSLLDAVIATSIDLPADWPEQPGVNTPAQLDWLGAHGDG